MHIRLIVTLAFACAGYAQTQLALAETLRCGSTLIEPGDDAAYVLEKCGAPNVSATPAGNVLSRGLNANLYPVVILRADRWRYHRGSGKFLAVLIIGDDGVVQDIQFERRGD